LKKIEEFYYDSKDKHHFIKIVKHLNNIYDKEEHVCNYRGAVVEVFGYELLKDKYDNENSSFGIDCYVYVSIEDESEQYLKKTIDVFAFNNQKNNGECYECKINENGFKRKNIKNLNKIYSMTSNKLSTGVISFCSSEAIKLKLSEIVDKNEDLNIDNINMLGINELKQFNIES
jgi:hypothetical protein